MSQVLREITPRGLILGCLLTILFSVSNVYLGLKIGGTFSCSIPAAIIAMVVLRWTKGSNILESNIVQTLASAAAAQASVVFILPTLILTGVWTHFHYWELVFQHLSRLVLDSFSCHRLLLSLNPYLL